MTIAGIFVVAKHSYTSLLKPSIGTNQLRCSCFSNKAEIVYPYKWFSLHISPTELTNLKMN